MFIFQLHVTLSGVWVWSQGEDQDDGFTTVCDLYAPYIQWKR